MADQGDRVDCPSCGKGLRWRAELAGRKVKCGCGHVFAMPATLAKPEPAPTPLDDGAFELDVPLIHQAAAAPGATTDKQPGGAGKCPQCGAAMKAGAVLCIQCGFNAATRTQLAPVSTGASTAAGKPAPVPRSKARLEEEEPDHRFTELYLPVILIVLGVMITVVRAYTGMGSITAEEEIIEDDETGGGLFGPPPAGWDDDDTMYGEDDGSDDGASDDSEEKDAGGKDPAKDADPTKEAATKDAATKDASTKDASTKDNKDPPVKDGEKDSPEPTKDAGTKDGAAKDAAAKDDGEDEPEPPAPPRRPRKPVVAKPAPAGPKSFNASPLFVAAFSIGFQLIITVPVVFGCVLFVAKYVDVTFGSLGSVILKITAIVLGPMALADWIDDALFAATMGMGAMLAWTIRIVLVGTALIKLFDLDFFEASVLLIVITMVRFFLSMILVLAIMRIFLG